MASLGGIKEAAKVAYAVMKYTKHSMLAGDAGHFLAALLFYFISLEFYCCFSLVIEIFLFFYA